MFRLIVSLLLVVIQVSGAMLSNSPQLCALRYTSALPYTGFRIYRRYSFGWPVLHHYLFIHCSYGRMDYSVFLPTQRNQNFAWNQTLCFDREWCFRGVRRKKYAPRKTPVYINNAMIGGLFKCNSPDCIESVAPILPLLADNPSNSISLREATRRVKYVPFASTPDFLNYHYPRVVAMDGIPNWSRELSITETYNYTSVDRAKPWFLANRMLNKMHDQLYLDESYYPWEFDYASRKMAQSGKTRV